jgi:hypothetical protein
MNDQLMPAAQEAGMDDTSGPQPEIVELEHVVMNEAVRV